MIRLNKLKMSNCFSYGPNNQIDLSGNTLSQILGQNGVGKSSIPLIIQQVLWNKNSKGIKKADIANRQVDQGYIASIQFTDGQDQYCIQVDRRKALKVALFCNGADISSHSSIQTYKQLHKILGFQFKTGTQLIYQHTNTSLQFLTATDSVRKQFLTKLFSLQKYQQIFQHFKARVSQQGKRLQLIRGKLQANQKNLQKNLSQNIQQKNLLSQPQQYLPEKFQQISIKKSEIANNQSRNNKVKNNQILKQKLGKIIIPKPVQKVQGQLETSKNISRMQAQIKPSEAYITKIQRLHDKCPTCQQTITQQFKESLLFQHRTKVQQLSQLVSQAKKQLNSIKKNNQLYNNYITKKSQYQTLQLQIDVQLQQQVRNIDDLTKQLQSLQQQLAQYNTNKRKILDHNQNAKKHNHRIQFILQQRQKLQQFISSTRKQLAQIKQSVGLLQALKAAFSPRGLITNKIQNAVQDLQDQTNKYLGHLSQGKFTIQFVVQGDKLNVQLTDNGNYISITALSSGQLARVNISTLLGIRSLMSSISNNKINILFLDQVISVLDQKGKQTLVQVLLNQIDLNIFLVSHGWQHPLVNKLQVIKQRGISKII